MSFMLPPVAPVATIPPGLQSLTNACARLYPDQPNPLQVAAVVKYWLGGPDPLDYISMYLNQGDPSNDIPTHWHYVSFGLSDLHGDGRVHEKSGPDTPSGFGFELSFRLKKEPDESAPPTWPAAVMQALAKYVFQSDNVLCDGDHVSWHCPLDNSESRIQHMLMTEDPQLGIVKTPFGPVQFIQIIGVAPEELKAAQQWNCRGVLSLLKEVQGGGGPYLVTDMRRGETIFELDPDTEEAVQLGIEHEGSDLSGVSARLSWSDSKPDEPHPSDNPCTSPKEDSSPHMSDQDSIQIRAVLQQGIRSPSHNVVSPRVSSPSRGCVDEIDPSGEIQQQKKLKFVHLELNSEAGLVIPLMLRGRLKHGRHFTFKNTTDPSAVTFVVESVNGAAATEENPFVLQGDWLQILIQQDLLEDMIDDVAMLSDPDSVELPKTFSWPHHRLAITVHPESD